MKLYVCNVSYEVNSEELVALFSQFGAVESAVVLYDNVTGRSRGFGFVRMMSAKDAEKAIKGLHGFNLRERDLVVRHAKQPMARNSFSRAHPPATVCYGSIWQPGERS